MIFLTLLAFDYHPGYSCINSNYNEINHNICVGQSYNFASRELPKINETMDKFLQDEEIERTVCREISDVFIYQIGTIELNELKDRLYPDMNTDTVWGLFDPRENNTTIYVTPHMGFNKKILYHEYAHFVFYNHCLGIQWDDNPENFALKFENYVGE